MRQGDAGDGDKNWRVRLIARAPELNMVKDGK